MKGLSRRGLPINHTSHKTVYWLCAQFAILGSKDVIFALDFSRERARSATNTFRVVDAIQGARVTYPARRCVKLLSWMTGYISAALLAEVWSF